MYRGGRAELAKSFARIHMASLIKSGIMPLTFADPADFDRLEQGTSLELRGILEGLKTGRMALCKVETGEEIPVCCAYTDRQQDILLAGGLLKYVAKENA